MDLSEENDNDANQTQNRNCEMQTNSTDQTNQTNNQILGMLQTRLNNHAQPNNSFLTNSISRNQQLLYIVDQNNLENFLHTGRLNMPTSTLQNHPLPYATVQPTPPVSMKQPSNTEDTLRQNNMQENNLNSLKIDIQEAMTNFQLHIQTTESGDDPNKLNRLSDLRDKLYKLQIYHRKIQNQLNTI